VTGQPLPSPRRDAPLPTALRSPRLVGFFSAYFARYLKRHLNGLRLARWGEPALPPGAGPVVVYTNHPGWWDAAIYILVGRELFPALEGYAPISSVMMGRYGFFGRIGGFGIDLETGRGAAAFLRACRDILSRPDRLLIVAAQGRFSDVRERPLGLKPGIARLPEIAPGAIFLPMAIEYSFWSERGAEALIAFGPARTGTELAALPRGDRRDRLETALTDTLDRLSLDVQSRDPARFRSLLEGRPGVGGVYDRWRKLTAALGGRRFDPAHDRGRR